MPTINPKPTLASCQPRLSTELLQELRPANSDNIIFSHETAAPATVTAVESVKTKTEGLTVKSTVHFSGSSPEEIFAILVNFENYPKQHKSNILSAEVERDEDRVKATYKLKVWGRTNWLTLDYFFPEKHCVTWKLAENDSTMLKENNGFFKVKRHSDGKQVILEHEQQVSLGSKNLLVRWANNAIKNRAEAGAKKLYEEIALEANKRLENSAS